MLLNTSVAANVMLTVNTFPWQHPQHFTAIGSISRLNSATFPDFPDEMVTFHTFELCTVMSRCTMYIQTGINYGEEKGEGRGAPSHVIMMSWILLLYCTAVV